MTDWALQDAKNRFGAVVDAGGVGFVACIPACDWFRLRRSAGDCKQRRAEHARCKAPPAAGRPRRFKALRYHVWSFSSY